MTKTFYITTPIYYPNGKPHLGHLYTTICADIIARFHRLKEYDVHFLTGTDEHGLKMVRTAEKLGITPKELSDTNSNIFKQAFKDFNVSNDDFIRTSESRHKDVVQKIVTQLQKNGDIYLGEYEGWYDEGQEEFITDTKAKENKYVSEVNGRSLVKHKESSYFFRTSKYRGLIHQLISEDRIRILPEFRKNEILNIIQNSKEDLSISRAGLEWGIKMPNDPTHTLYVWVDALSNYISALGWPNGEKFKYWPADLHLVGKEIIRFHAYFWPAILLSLKIPLPKTIFAHGWWTADGRKMGKSQSNFVSLEDYKAYADKYGQDTLRFYMLKNSQFGNDLKWNEKELDSTYTELANVLGNLLSRTVNIVNKFSNGEVPRCSLLDGSDQEIINMISRFSQQIETAYSRYELQKVVNLAMDLGRNINTYIDESKPWQLAKDDKSAFKLRTVIYSSVYALKAIFMYLLPVMPQKADEALKQLGVDSVNHFNVQRLLTQKTVKSENTILFPKIDSVDSENVKCLV